MDNNEKYICPQCGRETTNTAVIIYGGICGYCWHKNDNKRRKNNKKH